MKALHYIQQWFLSLIVRYHGRKASLRKATKQAVSYHLKNGKRYRVFFINNRYKAYNSNDLKKLKHQNKNFSINSTAMNGFAFFDTNNLTTT